MESESNTLESVHEVANERVKHKKRKKRSHKKNKKENDKSRSKRLDTGIEKSDSDGLFSHFANEVTSLLQCVVCQESCLYQLKFSDCCHNVCVFCYNTFLGCESTWSSNTFVSAIDGCLYVRVSHPSFSCPLCRKTSSISPAPLLLHNVLDRLLLDIKEFEVKTKHKMILPHLPTALQNCVYCHELLPSNSYAVTEHLLYCERRSTKCPRCLKMIRFSMKVKTKNAITPTTPIVPGVVPGVVSEMIPSGEENKPLQPIQTSSSSSSVKRTTHSNVECVINHLRKKCSALVSCNLCKQGIMTKHYSHHWNTLCKPHHDKHQKIIQTLSKLIHPERDAKAVDDIIHALTPILPSVENVINMSQYLADVNLQSIVHDIETLLESMNYQANSDVYHTLFDTIMRFRDDDDNISD